MSEWVIPIRMNSCMMSNGRIFFGGGQRKSNSTPLNLFYEMIDDWFTHLPNMHTAREGHCYAALGTRRVYAIGAMCVEDNKKTEMYDVQ